MGSSQASGIPGGYPASTVRRVPAIVTAGDAKAARAIYGESKAYLVVAAAPARRPRRSPRSSACPRSPRSGWSATPRASRRCSASPRCARELRKPLHVVPQFRNLYENAWETYRRALPGAPPGGPRPDARRRARALPLRRPARSRRRRRSRRSCAGARRDRLRLRARPRHRGVDARVLPGGARQARHPHGLLQPARGPLPPEQPAPDAGPAACGNRHYIEEMYEHRYQRELGQIVGARVAAPAQRARRLRACSSTTG